MSKKNFITLQKHRRQYRVFADDILDIHKLIHKKRPRVPAYEMPTQDESSELDVENISSS